MFISAIKIPKVMKAPGGRDITPMVVAPSAASFQPKMEPEPNSSLTAASTVKAQVKPKPMPKPSKMDETTEFLLAKASARPKTMQFTTIRG